MIILPFNSIQANLIFSKLGTSNIASSEENDLDREAAGDSGFSDGK